MSHVAPTTDLDAPARRLGFRLVRRIVAASRLTPCQASPMLISRPDGELVRDVPAYRRIMPFIMRGKNESAAYFDQEINLRNALTFIAEWNARSARPITLFHVYLWALVQTLHARPRLNRFVSGSRIYQRKGIWISYSAKKAMNDDSPVVVLKRRIEPGRPLSELVDALYTDLERGRSEAKSVVDKELGVLLALPAFLLRLLIRLQMWADAWNLLPASFLRSDPLYASTFVANLGSVKLDAVFHHLYEYGTIPIFACIGKIEDALHLDDEGQLQKRRVCHVKYTYDERVEDGLYCAAALAMLRAIVEDPLAHGIELPPALARESRESRDIARETAKSA